MGTSNFHAVNAQAMYVIDYGDDEFMWQECQEHLGDWIKELEPSFEVDDSIKSQSELRSFPTSSIGCFIHELAFLNLQFELHINVFIRSGYYRAANLDYEFEWYLEGYDYYEDISSILDEINYCPTNYDINPGLWAIHKSTLENKLAELEEFAISQVESILAQVSTPYGVTAQFSNGETIYHKLEA